MQASRGRAPSACRVSLSCAADTAPAVKVTQVACPGSPRARVRRVLLKITYPDLTASAMLRMSSSLSPPISRCWGDYGMSQHRRQLL